MHPELESDGKLPPIYLKGPIPSSIARSDTTDPTKQLLFGLTGITTATTRTLTIPDASGTIALIGGAGAAALTVGNDTNITLTLGGTPATALLVAASVTVAWAGILAVTRGGTGISTAVTRGDLLVGNSTPAWSNLAKGTAFQLLKSDGTDLLWVTPLTLVGVAYSPATPTPALAASGNAYVFADSGVNRVQPAMVRSEGRMQWLQNNLGWHRSMLITPMSTVPLSGIGCTLVATNGASMTNSFPAIDLTQVSGAKQINTAYTGVAANVQGNIRSTELLVGPGGSAGLGGYYFNCRFSPFMDNTTHTLMFVGLLNSTAAIGNTDPTSLTNCIGIGFNASLSNYFLLHNDGAGAAATVDLGSNYAFSIACTIQLELYCPPNSTTIYYRVTDLAHTNIAPTTGNFSSDVPAANTALAFHCHINTGTGGGATPSINLHRAYIESDI